MEGVDVSAVGRETRRSHWGSGSAWARRGRGRELPALGTRVQRLARGWCAEQRPGHGHAGRRGGRRHASYWLRQLPVTARRSDSVRRSRPANPSPPDGPRDRSCSGLGRQRPGLRRGRPAESRALRPLRRRRADLSLPRSPDPPDAKRPSIPGPRPGRSPPLDMVLGRGWGAGDKQVLSESPSFLQAALPVWASVARKVQPADIGQKTAALRLLEEGLIIATLSPRALF